MGKRTGQSTVLGMLFIAGGFYAATAAAQPSINLDSVTGSAGGAATFSATLQLNGSGAAVAGTQNDISFDFTNIPVGVATSGHCAVTVTHSCTTETDCPPLSSPFTGNEPCVNVSGPNCAPNPSIGKGGFFSFLPHGCSGSACTGIRALILAVDNITAIPDATELYTCTVDISSTAANNPYPLTVSDVVMSDTSSPAKQIVGATGVNGTVTVGTAPTDFLVCDAAPSTGSDLGQFGDNHIKNNDVVAIFKASLLTAPPAGSALFSAMDSAPVDAPPTCGGDTHIKNNDVVACFKLSLLGGTTYRRTLSGGTCTSVAH